MGALLEEDIMKLYSEFLPLLSKKRETIMHHIRKEYDNQKQLRTVPSAQR